MLSRNLLIRVGISSLFVLAAGLLKPQGITSSQLEHNVPAIVRQAIDLGQVSPDEERNITVHLKLPNQAAYDAGVEALYDPSSPTYQKWMTEADLRRYAPPAAQLEAVRQELEKHGLTVVAVDPSGFSLRAHGTTVNVEAAFQTHIHQFTMRNKTFQANVEDAKLTGKAGDLVGAVSGLMRSAVKPMIRQALDPRTGKSYPGVPISRVTNNAGLSAIITDICFTGPSAFTYTTPNSSLPVGVYFGNVYDNTTKICSYTPSQLQAHYGLPAAYAKGLNGTGQTIVLLEAYGYPTILDDANTFSSLTGLPELNSSNFEIVYPEGPPRNPNAGVELGWNVEIALDVQWAHTIAPKAKLIVVASAGQDSEDFQFAINYIATHHLANTVSDSWEEDSELFAGPAELASFDVVLKKAAAQGISVNFSSGDGGDDGNGSPIGSPEVPADSPYATAVGGTSIPNNPNGPGQEELGWGNDLTYAALGAVYDPPGQVGFIGGAGGGESVFYAKPSWQAALPGTGRQVPDISALADPYTGVPLVLTIGGKQYIFAGYGGTSLACPIFSAFWALADQSAGHPLGQAARRLATLSSGEITDVLPLSSPTNVAGTIFDQNGATYYSPTSLFSLALDGTTQFLSAVWPLGTNAGAILSLGTDSTLTVTPGWDNVTGFGVPNGLAFITGAGK